jgi:hypothetical protein
MKKISFLFFLLFTFGLKAQLVINEVSSSCNANVVSDDNGKSQDWVEIYNPTASPVNASGFYLTDKIASPLKWQMPNISIAAGGFMRVFCSGENRINGTWIHTNFKLDRAGDNIYIFNASSAQVDNMIFGDLELNHSYGRSPDGSATKGIFTAPTPGSSNTGIISAGYCPTVTVSLARGFFSSAQSLTLTCPGYNIRYTTDGSEPNATSILYTGPVSVTVTKVYKAKSFPMSGTLLPGRTITRSVFIGETQMGNLPVVSISMDPNDFNTVYYTTNYSSNYYPVRIGHIEYFKNEKKFSFETDFDLRLHGTTSTNLAQKGLRLSCKSEYNDPSMKDTLFPWDKPSIKKFDEINLRHDQGGGGIWDPYASQLASTLNVDYLAYRPCIVFVNGQYWGEYQMRESGNTDYIADNHPGVKKDSVDLLRQNLNWSTYTNSLVALDGSDTAFFNNVATINAMNPATTAFYNFFKTKFDEKSWFDYFISEIYVGNTDWLGANSGIINNIKLWKSQKPGGKWRYILYDCDYSIGIQTPSTDVIPYLLSPGTLNYHGQIFKQVMQNPTYKTYFINRFADLLNTRYQPNEANPVAIAMRDSLNPIIQRHLTRWGSTTYSQWQGYWTTYWIGSAAQRFAPLRNHIQSNFGMLAQVTTTFEVYPANAGTILLNTINPQTYPWTGVYFNGAPITVKPKAAPGFIFDHWESTDLGMNNLNDSNSVNLNSAQVVKLFFVPDGIGINEINNSVVKAIYPNPCNGVLKIQCKDDNAELRLFNVSGMKLNEKKVSSAKNETDISFLMTALADGIYFLEVRTEGGIYFEKIILNGNTD